MIGKAADAATRKVHKSLASLSISVAMATFNGSAYLGQQLADLAAQTTLPAELVVCDDGSTDETLDILEQFAASAPFRVRVRRNPERLGYRSNFLKCASLCQSDLIAFCDQDDRWLPTKLATMLTYFDDPDVLLAFHGAAIIAQDERPLGHFAQAARPIGASPPLSGSPWTFALGFTQIFRRSLCDCDRWWPLSLDHNSAEVRMAHDQWYFFLASVLGTIVNVDTPLVRYRQHDRNVFGWSKAKRRWHSRLLDRVRSVALLAERRVDAATQRAIILDAAAGALPSPFRERALKGADAYRHLAALCAKRAGIYAGTSFIGRARSFASLVRARGYGADAARLGASALLIDAFVGVSGLLDRTAREAAGTDAPGGIAS
ncbi:MAG TPA: glycosyltransferase [Sphingomicrobium sp.]|nr:glycosyltransferase [Sphingomicrobium sp.]